ncbi:hypothetical protein H4219_004752, partial [Mycoemilia scoparia]
MTLAADPQSKETKGQSAKPSHIVTDNNSVNSKVNNNDGDDDDDDEWDKRIKRTGCFKENEALLLCHADTHDW